MSDLVERLLATGGKGQGGPLKKEAAAEITRLRAALAQADAVIAHGCVNCYGKGSKKLREWEDSAIARHEARKGGPS